MKFKLGSIVILTVTVLLLTSFAAGCDSGGSYTITWGGIEASDTYLKGQYERFNGNYFRKLNLEKGDTLNFTLEINTQKGSLKVRLVNEDLEKVFKIEDDTVVNIEKSGSYKVVAIGDNHKSDFFVNWQVN